MFCHECVAESGALRFSATCTASVQPSRYSHCVFPLQFINRKSTQETFRFAIRVVFGCKSTNLFGDMQMFCINYHRFNFLKKSFRSVSVAFSVLFRRILYSKGDMGDGIAEGG